MSALRKQILSILIYVIIIWISSVRTNSAQEAPPEPTESSVKSVFIEDSCTPPCWFGITPGESTSADVERMFEKNETVFTWWCLYCSRREDGLIVNSSFGFRWRIYTRNDTPITSDGVDNNSQWSSYIQIDKSGVVDSIYMPANREITLGEALDVLGNPDDVYLVPLPNYDGNGGDAFGGSLTYIQQRIVIGIITYPYPSCTAKTILNDFHINSVSYYSIHIATKLVPTDIVHPNSSISYPQLVIPQLGGRQIRGDKWNQWIQGEGYERCQDFFDNLPEVYIVPTLPWSSPTVTPIPTDMTIQDAKSSN